MSESQRPAPGLAQAIGEQFSLQAATGGVRGIVESVLPIGVFSVVYAVQQQLWPAVLAATVVSVLAVLARLVVRQPLNQALSGLFGILLGAGVALYTGRAVDFFSVTIVKNIALLLLYLGSILVRWPFVGVLLGFALGEGTHWREVPARLRVYQLATWLWVGMCVVRLGVEIPLYLREHTTELGVFQVPLGVPLYALVLLLTWLLVRRVPRALPPPTDPEAGHDDPGSGHDPAEGPDPAAAPARREG